MELEVLKESINKSEPRYSRQEIEGIFEVKTKHTVRGMGRVMLFDLIIMSVVAIIMIGLAFIIGLQDRYFISLEIILVTGVLYLHYAIKRKLIYSQLSNAGITYSIENTLKTIKLYINFYKVLVPTIICSIFLKTAADIAQSFQLSNEIIVVITLAALPLGYGAYKLTTLLANKLYYPTIERLNQLKSQLCETLEETRIY